MCHGGTAGLVLAFAALMTEVGQLVAVPLYPEMISALKRNHRDHLAAAFKEAPA